MCVCVCYMILINSIGYHGALSQYILKKFFLLVLVLDRAKLTRVIDFDPCLFNKNSSFKVSETKSCLTGRGRVVVQGLFMSRKFTLH